MKYLGKITNPKDLVTKEYVDNGLSGKLGTSGDGSDVTAAFNAASSRTNISTGEKLTVIFGKIAKWFADLGAAAFRGVDSAPTDNSANLVESGGVKSALDAKANAESLAIVANGNTHIAITAGQYVYVKNHSTLTEGLYKAKSSISANATLSTTNLSSVSNGGLNDITTYSTSETIVGTWTNGKPIYRQVLTNTLSSTAGTFIVGSLGTRISMIVSTRFILKSGNNLMEGAVYPGSSPSVLDIGYVGVTGNVGYKNYASSYFGAEITAIIEYVKE